MPLIQVSVNQNKIEIDPLRIEKAAEAILNALEYTDGELSVVVVDDEEMARLNREYRQEDSTTDVLSFSMQEGEFGEVSPGLLGDVVISAPTAYEMSRQHQCSLASILDLLLVHGILHLVGYDHERNEVEAQRMDARTMELLETLGHPKESFPWYRAVRSEE